MRRAIRFFAFACCFSFASLAIANWTEEGPGPQLNGGEEGITNRPVNGAIVGIAVHPTSAAIAYVATVNGGIWKSNDADSANPGWRPLTDTRLPALSIASIAINPLDANMIFAGTGSISSNASDGSPGFGIVRSRDGGLTWQILAQSTFAGNRVTSILPTRLRLDGTPTTQVVLAGDRRGLWRSTNQGLTYVQMSGADGTGLPAGEASSIIADTIDGNAGADAISAGAGDDTIIYRSTAAVLDGESNGANGDTLSVTAGNLNLTAVGIPTLQNLEIIDLAAAGAQTLTLAQANVSAINGAQTLQVEDTGGSGAVATTDAWVDAGLVSIGGNQYHQCRTADCPNHFR